jgi:hypothetical protein
MILAIMGGYLGLANGSATATPLSAGSAPATAQADSSLVEQVGWRGRRHYRGHGRHWRRHHYRPVFYHRPRYYRPVRVYRHYGWRPRYHRPVRHYRHYRRW